MELLSCEVQGDPPALVVRGEVDAAGAAAFRAAIAELRSLVGARPAVIDLAAVTFLDSSGLAGLVDAASGGRPIVLRHPSPIVLRVIEMTGLDTLLPVEG